MRRNDRAERNKNIAMISTLGALIGIAGFAFFTLNSKEETAPIQTKVANHDIYVYKQDGTMHLFNTKDKAYVKDYNISDKSQIDKVENYINLFDMSKEKNNIYVSSPFSKEIVIFSQKENELKEINRLKVNNTIENFKVLNNNAFVHYLNSTTVDIYDLDSGKLNKTITFDENVSSLEVDEKYLYVSAGNYIEILPLESTSLTEKTKIHTGAMSTSLFKSTDGFLYAANTFATDLGNSVLVKINIENKNVEDILEIGKEFPISIFEKENLLYILCQGITDDVLDGISVIDKTNFERFKNISTGDTPNSMIHTEDGYIYVSHEDGNISVINTKNNFNIDTSFIINGVKNMIIK